MAFMSVKRQPLCHRERVARGNLIQISRAYRLRSPRRFAPRDDIKGSYFHSNDTKGDFSFIVICSASDNCDQSAMSAVEI